VEIDSAGPGKAVPLVLVVIVYQPLDFFVMEPDASWSSFAELSTVIEQPLVKFWR